MSDRINQYIDEAEQILLSQRQICRGDMADFITQKMWYDDLVWTDGIEHMHQSVWAKVIKGLQQRTGCYFHRGDMAWRIGPPPAWKPSQGSPYNEFLRRNKQAEICHQTIAREIRPENSLKQVESISSPSGRTSLLGFTKFVCVSSVGTHSSSGLALDDDHCARRCIVRGLFVLSNLHSLMGCGFPLYISFYALRLLKRGYIEELSSDIVRNRLRVNRLIFSADEIHAWLCQCLLEAAPLFDELCNRDVNRLDDICARFSFDANGSHLMNMTITNASQIDYRGSFLTSVRFVRKSFSRSVKSDDAVVVPGWTTKRR